MAEVIGFIEKNKDFTGIKMPAIINFYEYAGVKRFNKDDYEKLLEEEDIKYKEKLKRYNFYLDGVANSLGYKLKIKHHVFILIIATFILTLLFNIFYDFYLAIFLGFSISFVVNFIMLVIFQKRLDEFISKYKVDYPEKKDEDIISNKKREFFLNILDVIKNNWLSNFRGLAVSKYETLFFGNEGCALVNAESGRIILYGKENIKNILLEHKRLGSSTRGSSYSIGEMDNNGQLIFHVHRNISVAGSSRYDNYVESEQNSVTTDYYEWHLDILTDFMEYPNISIIFDDDDLEGIREAKVIYGIFGK